MIFGKVKLIDKHHDKNFEILTRIYYDWMNWIKFCGGTFILVARFYVKIYNYYDLGTEELW